MRGVLGSYRPAGHRARDFAILTLLIGLTSQVEAGVTVPKAEKYTVEGPVFSTAYARRSR
jgi:hypothetical protein